MLIRFEYYQLNMIKNYHSKSVCVNTCNIDVYLPVTVKAKLLTLSTLPALLFALQWYMPLSPALTPMSVTTFLLMSSRSDWNNLMLFLYHSYDGSG